MCSAEWWNANVTGSDVVVLVVVVVIYGLLKLLFELMAKED